MKSFILSVVSLLCLTLPLSGQMAPFDTIRIMEVRISSGRGFSGLSPSAGLTVDSSLKMTYDLNSVAELLTDNNLMHIKSYGPGGIASPSFRGTGAGHTTVTWNGININNPMHGQSDLSLLPSGLADEISIFSGGGKVLSNGGAIGGIISLETTPDWDEGYSVSLNGGTASFGRYSGLAALRIGNSQISSVSRAYLSSSENKFPYINDVQGNEPFTDRRKNSSMHTEGFLQELYLKGTRSISSARVWYNTSERDIPVPIITRQPVPGESQNDRSFRSLLDYQLRLPGSEISAGAAFVADRLVYLNPETSTDSRNLVRTVTLKTEVSPLTGERTRLTVFASHELNMVNSNNYEGRKTRNTSLIAVNATRSFLPSLAADMLLRGKLSDGKLINPDFAAGLEYHLPSPTGLNVRADISGNSRLPGLNDLYWIPGGNPWLKSEYGISCELGLRYKGRSERNRSVSAGLNVFRNRIGNMIHWYPGESSFWSPVNLGQVRILGTELTAEGNYITGKLYLKVNGSWSYTRASETTEEPRERDRHQIVYVPVYQANAGVKAGYGILSASFNSSYTGRRYLSADNSDYLPGYLLCDLSTGVEKEVGKADIKMNFRISNLFNVNYQAVAWHPMPGRSYSVSILLVLKN